MTDFKSPRSRFRMFSVICALLLSASLCGAAEPMTRDQAARHVQQQYGGKILDLQPVKTSSGKAYRVKLLQQSGRVKLMLIDASSGQQLPFK